MSFGQKYTMGNETTPKYRMMTSMKDKGGGYDKAEAVKKVKDYNQIRNHVMASTQRQSGRQQPQKASAERGPKEEITFF